MLTKFLRAAAGAKKSIQYVGGYVQGFVGSSSNINISLTSLTGGLATAPDAGDFVLVYFGTGSNNDRNLVVSGYTEITELFSSDSTSTNLAVAYKFMSSTPDTTVTLTGGTLGGEDAGAVYISVWRNVNTTTPMDVTATTSTTVNTARANPPSITPTTSGTIIVAGGAGGHEAAGQSTSAYTSSDLTAFRTISQNDTYNVTIGGGYKEWTGGAFDAAQFGFNRTDSTLYSAAAVTVALRPA